MRRGLMGATDTATEGGSHRSREGGRAGNLQIWRATQAASSPPPLSTPCSTVPVRLASAVAAGVMGRNCGAPRPRRVGRVIWWSAVVARSLLTSQVMRVCVSVAGSFAVVWRVQSLSPARPAPLSLARACACVCECALSLSGPLLLTDKDMQGVRGQSPWNIILHPAATTSLRMRSRRAPTPGSPLGGRGREAMVSWGQV